MLISSFVVFGMFNPGIEYFPEGILSGPVPTYRLRHRVGTNVEFTESVIDELERKVPQIPNSGDVESVLSTVRFGYYWRILWQQPGQLYRIWGPSCSISWIIKQRTKELTFEVDRVRAQ
ncbi:MAG: hypothetical protein U5J63_17930 [Fodinibius sp.]|nr:hypothetical protein [Fodinibius sp.]